MLVSPARMLPYRHRIGDIRAEGNASVHIGDRHNYYSQNSTEDERLGVLTWLDPPVSLPPPNSRPEPGTNLWFLETDAFTSWHTGDKRFLFLHGDVGCGKTSLLTSIAKKCESFPYPDHLVIVFYFSATMNEKLDLSAFLCYLVAQLCNEPAIRIPLKNLCDRHRRRFPPTPPSEDDLKETVAALLCRPHGELYNGPAASMASASDIYVLVDGIDEIRNHSVRREVTDYLNELSALPSPKHRVLATSRSDYHILKSLRADCGWCLEPIPRDSVRADIQLYVKRELTRRHELDDLDDATRTTLLDRLAGPEQNM